jgi:hypothetical protein
MNRVTGVIAGLVPATSSFQARSKSNRGGRDKPGHDGAEMPSVSADQNPLYGRGMTWPHTLQVRCASLSKKRA